MSKSLNILLPAIGVTGIVLGAAYGLSTRDFKATEAEIAMKAAEAAKAEAAAQAEANATLAAEIAAVQEKAAEAQAALEARPAGASLTELAPMSDGPMGIGRVALPEEIAAWDVDVLPGGRGLPEGSGDVFTGEEVFVEKCAACHGDFAEGVDNWPVLAGGFDTLANEDPVKTVGSYWPHLSTAWDYISRSMPFGEAGTLTADETYAIVAYILYSNDLVDDDFELTHENFGEFEMYNGNGFVIDDRPELEYAAWQAEPCMEGCKDEVEITMRSVFLVETPPEGGSESMMNPATIDGLPSFTAAGPSFIPEAEAPVQHASTDMATEEEPAPAADAGAALIADGEKVFRKCKSCHQVGPGAKNRTGPVLTGIMDAPMGQADGFGYSNVFKQAAEEGRVWTEDEMAAFLAAPKAYMSGTKMSFAGLKSDEDIAAIIAYLRSVEG